jgi:hypothetical protein
MYRKTSGREVRSGKKLKTKERDQRVFLHFPAQNASHVRTRIKGMFTTYIRERWFLGKELSSSDQQHCSKQKYHYRHHAAQEGNEPCFCEEVTPGEARCEARVTNGLSVMSNCLIQDTAITSIYVTANRMTCSFSLGIHCLEYWRGSNIDADVVVGWGTMLQTEGFWVWFSMKSLDFLFT